VAPDDADETTPEKCTLTVVVSGSVAFDHIMVFPGHFEDHILPDKIHILNVSFLVDSLDKLRGGVAGNISYSLGLLRQPARIVATVGTDFDSYREVLTGLGVDTSAVVIVEDELTASAFITTDRADNQITGFYPGAMARAGDHAITDALDGVELAIVSPTAPDAMRRHSRELAESSTPYMFDPGQQIIALPATALREGIEHAEILIGNDYEFAMISEKTGLSRQDLIESCPVVVVTFGELGSHIYADGQRLDIPAVVPSAVVDPTGAGDGYRAGLIAARLAGLPWDVAGRVGSLAATFVVEVKGTQSHSYTFTEFSNRFDIEFPEHAGALQAFERRLDRAVQQGE
jgi:adenosine kinase